MNNPTNIILIAINVALVCIIIIVLYDIGTQRLLSAYFRARATRLEREREYHRIEKEFELVYREQCYKDMMDANLGYGTQVALDVIDRVEKDEKL